MSMSQGTPQAGLHSIGSIARLVNAHPNTIRKYANSGALKTYRIGPHGKRKFALSDVEKFFFGKVENENCVGGESEVLCYIRSSCGASAIGFSKGEDKNDLGRQKLRVQQFCRESYGHEGLLFSDVGSGLGYENRRAFSRLFKERLAHRHDGATLVVENKDRLARFGTEVLKWICEAHQIKLVFTDQHEESEAGELAQDLLNIIHVFSSRSYGIRSALRNKKRISPQIIEKLRSWRAAGTSINQIVKLAKSQGLKTDDGGPISYKVTQRVLLVESPQLEQNRENSIDRFISEKVVQGSGGLRLRKSDLYSCYLKFAQENNLPILSASLVGRKLVSIGIRATTIADKISSNKKVWCGIYIKDNENQSVLVREMPKKFVAKTPQDNHFLNFFNTVLRGRQWRGSEILARYKAFCQGHNLKRETRPRIVRMLADLGFTSTVQRTGFVYDLRAAKEVLVNSVLPLGRILAPSAISRCF